MDEFSFDAYLEDNPQVASAMEDAQTRHVLIENLIGCRKAMGLSQKDVAARMETTQSAVSDLEQRRNDPRLSTLQRYARAVTAEFTFRVDMSTATCWPTERPIQAVIRTENVQQLSSDQLQSARVTAAALSGAGVR